MRSRRIPTTEGYTTNHDHELHYYKSRVTRKQVLADKASLTPGWWKLRETKNEYVLEMDEEKARASLRKKKNPFLGF